MEKILLKFIRFIFNPITGFIFYLICVATHLYYPPEGMGLVLFVFLLPFVLFIVIGLNLPLFGSLFGRLTMSKTKKINHALEHGTIYFLRKQLGKDVKVGGSAEKKGFRISGVQKKNDIMQAFERFVDEFNQKNPDLFVSLRCGSNILTSQGFGIILLTATAIALHFTNPSDTTVAVALLANVLIYILLRKSLGNLIQEHFFMSTDFENAKIHSINKTKKTIFWESDPVYFVRTIIE